MSFVDDSNHTSLDMNIVHHSLPRTAAQKPNQPDTKFHLVMPHSKIVDEVAEGLVDKVVDTFVDTVGCRQAYWNPSMACSDGPLLRRSENYGLACLRVVDRTLQTPLQE